MQYKFFTVPVTHGEEDAEYLNKFLRSNKIVKVDKQLVPVGEEVLWSFCVQYLLPPLQTPVGERKEKIDYKSVLDENAFEMFSRLRKCRKIISAEEAVPAFAVFVDAELAEMAKMPQLTEKGISEINGIGRQRAEKFGRKLIEKYNEKVW